MQLEMGKKYIKSNPKSILLMRIRKEDSYE